MSSLHAWAVLVTIGSVGEPTLARTAAERRVRGAAEGSEPPDTLRDSLRGPRGARPPRDEFGSGRDGGSALAPKRSSGLEATPERVSNLSDNRRVSARTATDCAGLAVIGHMGWRERLV